MQSHLYDDESLRLTTNDYSQNDTIWNSDIALYGTAKVEGFSDSRGPTLLSKCETVNFHFLSKKFWSENYPGKSEGSYVDDNIFFFWEFTFTLHKKCTLSPRYWHTSIGKYQTFFLHSSIVRFWITLARSIT